MNRIVKLAFASVSLALSVALTVLALALPSLAHAHSSRIVSRDYPWSADHLTLDVPADVRFTRGPTWHLSIRGPEHTLDQLIIRNGRIRAKEHGCLSLIPFCIGYGSHIEHTVHVVLTGPALQRVTVNSSGRIELSGLHQNRLAVQINGSGSVSTSGTVDDSRVEINGSGSIDLDGLRQNRLVAEISGSGTIRGSGSTRDLKADISGSGNILLARMADMNARVSVSGSGNVDISPIDSVSVGVSGSGDVHLHSHPRSLSLHVSGSGGVTERPAGRSGAAAR